MISRKKLFKQDFGNLTQQEIVFLFLSCYIDEHFLSEYFSYTESKKLAKSLFNKNQIKR
jgi:hypothetical protein